MRARSTFRLLAFPVAAAAAVPVALATFAVACGDDKPPAMTAMPDMAVRVDPFKPQPECRPADLKVQPLAGDRAMLISSLAIADFCEGFDLNGDGKIDNKLSPIGSLANAQIADSFKFDHNLVIPIEMFGYQGQDSACTKFAFYLGRVLEDRDHDGADTSFAAGKADCDDTNAATHPGATELPDRMDNDCDGYADNSVKGQPPTDTQDLDGDGYSLAQGDCDDRPNNPIAKDRHPGATEKCNTGIDWNCDGIPDNGPACDPYGNNKVPIHVTTQSFAQSAADGGVPGGDADGGVIDPKGLTPYIVFPDGTVKNNQLNAGPDLFQLAVPIGGDALTLKLDGVHVRMHLDDKPLGTYVDASGDKNPDPHCASKALPGGILGGVLETITMAQIKNLNFGGVITKDQSLADAVFVGPVAAILALDSDKDGHYQPDIDVDGDGLETFWQAGNTKPAKIDSCKDGDGTIIHSDFDGKGTSCTQAIDPKTGKPRFVDGISVALRFTAVPVRLQDITQK